MVEAMIKPTSGLLSQSLSEADFRGWVQPYGGRITP